MSFVSLDDHLDEFVPDDIFFGEVNKLDSFEVGENVFGFFNAAFLAAGKIDLSFVAGDDGL